MLNREKIEALVEQLLEEFDEDPKRSGLRDTPKRVAGYWIELLEGAKYSNDEIAEMFDKCFEDEPNSVAMTDGLVIEKNIAAFSHCEHHLALMYDLKIHIAYIPNGKVIGLSKMARIVDMVCKRLQLQERIGADINYIMRKIVNTKDVAVIIDGKHACMTARGVKNYSAQTSTANLSGRFSVEPDLRSELYSLLP